MSKRKRKNKGSNLIGFFILPIIFAAIGFGIWYFYGGTSEMTTTSSIEFIRRHMNSQGKIIDYNGEIKAETIEDIKLFITKKQVKIKFGKIDLTWKLQDFELPETKEELKKIGITMDSDPKTDKIRVYYRGEELTRWVS